MKAALSTYPRTVQGFDTYTQRLAQDGQQLTGAEIDAASAHFASSPAERASMRERLVELSAQIAGEVGAKTKVQTEQGATGTMPLGFKKQQGVAPNRFMFDSGLPQGETVPLEKVTAALEQIRAHLLNAAGDDGIVSRADAKNLVDSLQGVEKETVAWFYEVMRRLRYNRTGERITRDKVNAFCDRIADYIANRDTDGDNKLTGDEISRGPRPRVFEIGRPLVKRIVEMARAGME